ncbi:hypothetical protein LDENG_00118730 [Lucifuga dentata]|nr:hypothetical protein LDENG_00118730 [Lucifuga dentata]
MLRVWFALVFNQLRNIGKLRPIVSQTEIEIVIHAFISSCLDYCNSLFTCMNFYNLITRRTFRSSDQGLLSVPQSRLKTKGNRAFEVIAPKLWNSLPSNLRSLDSVDSLKKQLKTHLFRLAFG